MIPASNNLLLASADEGYNLTRSLRFRSSASAYLQRTQTTVTDGKKCTFSGWVKRSKLGASQIIFAGTYGAGGNYGLLYFDSTDTLRYWQLSAGSTTEALYVTNAVYRDVSAWYHVAMIVDTTLATAGDRIKLYINGSLITAYSTQTTISLNSLTPLSISGWYHNLGAALDGTVQSFLDGYLTEVNFIDGQALTPSSFGSTNTLTGVWQPARYVGTYGTNGFYLPFTDNSALTTSSNVGLGKDFSGNGNYWTTNNISITAGVTYDSMTDVPTLTSATAANFAVLNPLQNAGSASSANLNYSATTTAVQNIFGTMALPPTQKIYFEVTYATGTASGSYASVGVTTASLGLSTAAGTVSGSWAIESNQATDSIKRDQGSATSYGGGTYFSTGQVCMIAVDQAAGKIWYGKDGTWFASGDPAAGTNAASTSVSTTATLFPVSTAYGTTPVLAYNFGQRPFTYTPPTGYVALNTYNLPTSTIVKGNTVMDATLYTGNGSTQTITNAAGFQPDLVWMKDRSAAYEGAIFDSVRGTGLTKSLTPSSTRAESGNTTDFNLTSFNSNGFSLASTSGANPLNRTGDSYVGWQWQAGQGTTSSNTNGSITSTVSVNASAGFSIVSYTGTAANATVGHGLGVAPSFIVAKRRVTGGYNWIAWHSAFAGTQFIKLNSTDAYAGSAAVWNSTTPTSSVFSLGSDTTINPSGEACIAYCWTPIAGYSAMGSYSGNGSTDGSFVYTGFRPKFVMIKRIDSTASWGIKDTSRNTSNTATQTLFPNLSNEEYSVYYNIDILSNGFKCRDTDSLINASGGTYIYMAFAETPTKFALAR